MISGIDILAAHAAQQPDKPALVDEDGRVVGYADLNARVNRAASAMQGLELHRGERCVHVHYNCIEEFEIAHALRKLQAVSTPMNYRLRGAEIAYLLNDSGARVIVAGPEFTEHIDEARPTVEEAAARHWLVLGRGPAPVGWELYEEHLAGSSEKEPESPAEVTGPTMVYTAGTTGNPKGAYRPSGVGLETILQWVSAFGVTPDDVHLLAGPSYHSAPGAFAGLQQILGATCVIMRRFDAEKALQLIERHRVSTTFMAPILLKRILDLAPEVRSGYDVSSMRALIVAAAPFPANLKQRAVEYFGDVVYEFYGATETGIVTLIGPEDLLRKPNSCGRPFTDVEVRLLDDEGNEVGVGEPGELWARSRQLLGEYFNKPEATQRNMRDGFFTVGDVAYRDDEGFIHICDRKVDMVISGGVNIYPAEVEAMLFTYPAVADCAVIGVPDDEWGEALKAIVQLRAGARASAQELIAFCGERLAGYKRPRSVEIVAALPRDAAGKLLKRDLRDRYWQAAGRRI